MTGLAGALHLGHRLRRAEGAMMTPAPDPAEVRFKDLGALPVCGGSVRPAASQHAMAQVARRRGQP